MYLYTCLQSILLSSNLIPYMLCLHLHNKLQRLLNVLELFYKE
ncbi:hypothetical protein PNI0153_01346 [Streptococcus pneumoniae PNI0153]|nr:hypothetical protein PNI0153_01346 [Streptococcus pneumoniae PNI0153]